MENKRLDGLVQITQKNLRGGGVLRLLKNDKDNYQVEFAVSGQKPTFLLKDPRIYGENVKIETIYERIKNTGGFWSERDEISLLLDSGETESLDDLGDSACGVGNFSMEGSGTYDALEEVDEDY